MMDGEDQEDVRKHGLELPHNGYQILSWGIFGSDLIFYFAIYMNVLAEPAKMILSVLYGLLALNTAVLCMLSTVTDPTDETVYEEREKRAKNQPFITSLIHFCRNCKTHVHGKSKHCGKCNRCVDIFDHHCEWLNNCIGKKNYGYFFCLTVSMTVQTIVKMIVGWTVIGILKEEGEEVREEIAKNFVNGNISTLMTIITVSVIKDPIVVLLLGNLLALHIWLRCKGITTYDYILIRRERKKQKELKKEMIKSTPPLNYNNNHDAISIKENKESEIPIKKGNHEEKSEESENLESQQSEVLGYNLKNTILSENMIKKPNSEKTNEENKNKEERLEVEVKPLDALETFKPNKESVRSHLSADIVDDVSINLSANLKEMKSFDDDFKFKN